MGGFWYHATMNPTVAFVVAGIAFYQEVNGHLYPLRNGAFNALSVVMAV